MKILIATHNQSKFERYKKIIEVIDDLEIVSLSDLDINHKAEENYTSNIENAMHKARVYGDLSGLITLAVDEALMTNFLPDNQQPGVYARRFTDNKKELTDAELIEVWKKIFTMYPQTDKQFIWDFAIASYNPENKTEFIESVEEISYVAKYFSPIKSNGYPMSTFLSHKKDFKPDIEVSQEENEKKDFEIFKKFNQTFHAWLQNQK